MLPDWNDRPQVTANLNNPAFCCEVMRLCAKSYREESLKSFPFSLSVFVLPLILSGMNRKSLPKTKSTSLHNWLNDNEELRIKFPEQIISFMPFTKETIKFGIVYNSFILDESGGIDVINQKSAYSSDDPEVKECITKANLMGKMLAKAGDQFTIYSLFGIKP